MTPSNEYRYEAERQAHVESVAELQQRTEERNTTRWVAAALLVMVLLMAVGRIA